MGIYIKKVSMPPNCYYCFCFAADADLCMTLNRQAAVCGRLNECDLTEVRPHGRLIDADELVMEVRRSAFLDDYLKDAIECIVGLQPTIINEDREEDE